MMIPGRILIVDNRRGEVDDLVDEFLRRGEHAIYSGITVESEYCNNVRLLILDYWLIESSEKDSLNTIATVVNDVFKRSKFFMIVIWSAKVTEDNKEAYEKSIKNTYETRFDQHMPGILLKPISKDELDYVKLIERIETEISSHPNLNLIYEVEKIIDKTKDKAMNQIYDIGNWSNLIKSLKLEYDVNTIKRHILYIYLNLLKRNVDPAESAKLENCIKLLIKEIEPFDVDNFGKVYSAQYYYQILDKEQIGTGDIFQNEKLNRYYIIITPECDITNDKHTATKMIESRRINHSELWDPEYLKKIKEEIPALGNIERKDIIKAVIHGKNLKSNYYNLNFLHDYARGEFYHLIFDFHKVKSLKKARRVYELSGYNRVCRVDSPLINDFVQQYASHCSRFGTMSIPKEISETLKSKLRQAQEQLKKKKVQKKGTIKG